MKSLSKLLIHPYSVGKKLTRKALIGIIALIVIAGPLIYLTIINSKPVKAAWYNDNWAYRQAVNVTVTSSSSDQTNVDTLITVDTSSITSKMLTDCEDLRFVSQAGKLLPFFFDNCKNSSTANKIWVKIDLVPKNTTTYTMYMYYGNPTAKTDDGLSAPSGLAGYWRLNESSWTNDCSTTSVIDSSGNGNNGKACPNATGPTGGATGKFAKAGQLDGSDDYIDLGAPSALNFERTNAFTISSWMKVTTAIAGNQGSIVARMDPSASYRGYDLYYCGTGSSACPIGSFKSHIISTWTSNAIAVYPTTGKNINDNLWHHVVATYDGSSSASGLSLYLDGAKLPVTTEYDSLSATIIPSVNWRIGSRNSGSLFPGTVDDVRIYNRNLSAVEVSHLYNDTAPTNVNLFNGLTTYLTLNDGGSSATTADSSVMANNGTLNIGASGTQTTAASAWTAGATGKFGGSISLDGTDDYINFASAFTAVTSTTPFTKSLWFYATAQNKCIMSELGQSAINSGYNYCIFPLDGTTLYGTMWTGSLTNVNLGTVSLNAWNHVVLTFDGVNRLTGYLNGNLIASTTTGAYTPPTNLYYGIGATETGQSVGSGTGYFAGQIDDVKIYNRAISGAEVTQLYNTTGTSAPVGTVVPTTSFATEEQAPGPVAYWKFDDATGTSAKDSSSTNATGILAGTTKPTWQTEDLCLSGKCLYFDGSSSKVTVATAITGVQSVSIWVKPISVSSSALIDLDGGTHKITVSSGTISATGFTSPTIYVNGIVTSTLTTNTWQLVTVTTGTTFNTTSSLTLGNSSSTYFNGFIDEVKIYNYARTAAQVTTDYTSRGSVKGIAESVGSADNAALNKGLVGYWKMNESSWTVDCSTTSVTDSSGNANNGKSCPNSTGPAGGAAGKFGNAGSFDGVNDYVDAGTSSTLNATGSISVSAWAYWNSLPSSDDTVLRKSTGSALYLLGFQDGAGNMVFRVDTSGGQNKATYAKSNFSSGTWYHLTGVYDQNSNTAKLYVNGAQVASVTTTGLPSITSGTFYIGSSGGSSDFLNGKTDEVRVYNRALSPSEVSTLYNFAPGPIGYWNFDENTGSSANDISGNANTGTWNGTLGSQWVPGKIGKAGNFNGTNNYVDLVNRSIVNFDQTNAFTINTWIKTTGSGLRILFNNQGGSPYTGTAFHLESGVLVFQFINNHPTNYLDVRTTQTVNDGLWHHVGMTYDGSKTPSGVKFYIDGVSMTTSTVANTLNGSTTSSAPAAIGASNNETANFFPGQIDEVRIYNYARTAQQIVQDMNAGHPPPGSPVGSALGHWKFDEGYGITANNAGNQGSTLNGTLSGMSSPATSTSGWTQSGKFGKALNFDGSNDYVSATVTGARTNILTVSAWIKPTAVSTRQDFMASGNATAYSTNNWIFSIKGNTGSNGGLEVLGYSASEATTDLDTAGSLLTAGQWAYVTFTSDGTTVNIYVNGNLVKSGALTLNAGNTNGEFIGASNNGGGVGAQFYAGQIDEPKIYNFALTASQIAADMNRGQAQVLGALSDNSTYQPNAANQIYCVPGDTSTCTAPVGEWNFEEGQGTTVNDTSGNANTGTIAGSTWTNGKYGKALKFGTTSDYVTTGTFTASTNYSIEMWLKTAASISTESQLMETRDTGTIGITIGVTTDKLLFYDGAVLNGATTINPNTWYHVVAVKSGSNKYFYLNGSLDASGTATNTLPNNAMSFGARGASGQLGNRPLNGTLDNIRVFNYARTASQVAWDYNKGGPIGYWKFNECQGSVANDSTSNANNGTITVGGSGTYTSLGTCTSSSASTVWYNGRTGKYNGSLAFDGTDDYVAITSLNNMTYLPITYSAWVKVSANPPDCGDKARTIVGRETFGSLVQGAIVLYCGSGLTNEFAYYPGATLARSLFTPTLGTWYHITYTEDANKNFKWYINGQQTNSGTDTTTSSLNAEFRIGASSGDRFYFSGQIDDVRIYNYALTATQVKTLYNQGGAVRYGPTTGNP